MTDDTHVVDPEALELGTTQLEMTAVRKPRWTPEIGSLPPSGIERGARAHAHAGHDGGVAQPHGDDAAYDLLHQKNPRR